MVLNNKTIPIESIIGKIDNDFNLDNTDWIPRVISWTYDALNQLDVLKTTTTIKKMAVVNGFARTSCDFATKGLVILDENDCKMKEYDDKIAQRCHTPLRGIGIDETIESSGTVELSKTIGISNTDSNKDYYDSFAKFNDGLNVEQKYDVDNRIYASPRRGYGENYYVIVDNHTIEVIGNTKYISIITNEIKTIYSEYFKCNVPVIPNNGILVEAIGYYCMYKMLCRGYKHPVFNLNASQYGTNPFYEWNRLKDIAKRSVLKDWQDVDTDAWQSYFYNYTFPKR